ncbi:MAG: hypothetical protein CVU64_09520 [Deltaproteobacteria bacterium HGW-Deltaproteobacteria-21]|nr:MAG: hypothetical protein CVU64_09520 [Deltaproteobacteria bacterium HGW-Deltaproteobacteria-21]
MKSAAMSLPRAGYPDRPILLEPEKAKRLHRQHVQGAYVRSGASLAMCLVAVIGFLVGNITRENLTGIAVCVAFDILINPPTLAVLRRIRAKRSYEIFSVFINFLDIIAFTGIIYFVGGIVYLWLSLTLAALITYVGVLGPPRLPFILAGLSALCLTLMVFLEHYGIIPHMDPLEIAPIRLVYQLVILLSVISLLFVVAFIASYTGSLLRRQQAKLRKQKTELEESRESLRTAQEELLKSNDELENRVQARTAELGKAVQALEAANLAKSDFLANMSHELRTPLNHVMGFTELVLDKNFGDLNATQEEYLGDVLLSSRHLLSLINDILDLSKVEAGKLDLNLGEVNPRELIENSLLMIREKAIKHGIRVAAETRDLPGTIRADERKLKQIMYNLLSNAMKFTPDGGEIRVTANIVQDFRFRTPESERSWEKTATHNPNREHSGHLQSSGIRVCVADTGIGIEPDNLERIFKPFEQVESSTSRKYQGTGLGLSLTRSLVELHGGRIWADSGGEGKGSAFCFQIPLRP